MKPIKVASTNSHELMVALNAVQAGFPDNRISVVRLFSCVDQFESQLRLYKLPRANRVGAVGEIYAARQGRHSAALGQTCTHVALERRSSGWFLTEATRLPAVCSCHLQLTLDQAERILERSEPGRVVLRAFNELRATIVWQPLDDRSQQDAITKIAALGSADSSVYSALMTLGLERPESIQAFFRAIGQAAAKQKVAAVLEQARSTANVSVACRYFPPR